MRASSRQLAEALNALLEEGQVKPEAVFTSFRRFLEKKKLVIQSREILNELSLLLDRTAGRQKVLVTTAKTVEKNLRNTIVEHVKELVSARELEIDFVTDSEVIGGMKVESEDIRYDATIRRKLRGIAQTL